jgi:hypothetical protein
MGDSVSERDQVDPFVPYHDSVDRALTTMLNRPYMTGAHAPTAEGSVDKADQSPRLTSLDQRLSAQELIGPKLTNSVRFQQLRPALERLLENEGLPAQLSAVVLIESGAQPNAVSPKDARGLWQLIPATAQRYGLNVTAVRDDRLDTERATRAAARYLHDLHLRFRDWPLALAAYNAGEQAVQRALDRLKGADFWRLSSKKLLPEETRKYVPAVLVAMKRLANDTEPFAGTAVPSHSTARLAVRSKVVYATSFATD